MKKLSPIEYYLWGRVVQDLTVNGVAKMAEAIQEADTYIEAIRQRIPKEAVQAMGKCLACPLDKPDSMDQAIINLAQERAATSSVGKVYRPKDPSLGDWEALEELLGREATLYETRLFERFYRCTGRSCPTTTTP